MDSEEVRRLATWGRLKFKPRKSRSLILRKGVVTSRMFEMQAENTIGTGRSHPLPREVV